MHWLISAFLNLLYDCGAIAVGLLLIAATTYFVGLFAGTAWECVAEYRTGRRQNGDALIGFGIAGGIWALFVCLNAPGIAAMFMPCIWPIIIAFVANAILYTLFKPASHQAT